MITKVVRHDWQVIRRGPDHQPLVYWTYELPFGTIWHYSTDVTDRLPRCHRFRVLGMRG